jgi:hypothetical protein
LLEIFHKSLRQFWLQFTADIRKHFRLSLSLSRPRDDSYKKGKMVAVRLREVAYTLSPMHQNVMNGLWKDAAVKLRKRVADNWTSALTLVVPVASTYWYAYFLRAFRFQHQEVSWYSNLFSAATAAVSLSLSLSLLQIFVMFWFWSSHQGTSCDKSVKRFSSTSPTNVKKSIHAFLCRT